MGSWLRDWFLVIVIWAYSIGLNIVFFYLNQPVYVLVTTTIMLVSYFVRESQLRGEQK